MQARIHQYAASFLPDEPVRSGRPMLAAIGLIPGFVSFAMLDVGDGRLASICVCEEPGSAGCGRLGGFGLDSRAHGIGDGFSRCHYGRDRFAARPVGHVAATVGGVRHEMWIFVRLRYWPHVATAMCLKVGAVLLASCVVELAAHGSTNC